MTPVFELDNVTKRFGRFTALDGISFHGDPGRVIALMGDNGAGKTTSLKILLGLLNPDLGQARVFGLDSRKQGWEIRRRVGYMADKPALYDWMTVAEIGWFAAGFYPLGFQDRYRQLIQKFELPTDRKLSKLSKGMLAKVALSLSLAHEPQLLVLDEPTSGLDPVVRREFLESMVDVAATGRTVLLSSHQIGEVERVADDVVILRGGRVVLNESLESIKNSIREVILTRVEATSVPPTGADLGQILSSRQHDRQWRLLVKGADEDALQLWTATGEFLDVDFRTPSLEEICVGYLTSHASSGHESNAAVSAPEGGSR
jgi:ABC-2 type transport system ATP-binding protein